LHPFQWEKGGGRKRYGLGEESKATVTGEPIHQRENIKGGTAETKKILVYFTGRT